MLTCPSRHKVIRLEQLKNKEPGIQLLRVFAMTLITAAFKTISRGSILTNLLTMQTTTSLSTPTTLHSYTWLTKLFNKNSPYNKNPTIKQLHSLNNSNNSNNSHNSNSSNYRCSSNNNTLNLNREMLL